MNAKVSLDENSIDLNNCSENLTRNLEYENASEGQPGAGTKNVNALSSHMPHRTDRTPARRLPSVERAVPLGGRNVRGGGGIPPIRGLAVGSA
jgi:hypothetical protein